jgi:undecaprenyl phosphate N,N'-diacetylbacillosamine 1-phosphate transferase
MMRESVKRLIDVSVGLVVLVAFLPVWMVVAVLVKVTSRGPVLFLQERPGQYGHRFTIYKFRTMKQGSECMVKGVEVSPEDERITPMGRFLRRSKVDEIPQLLNVLKGEMSLVGPRPERLASVAEYDAETSKRLNVRPGMTGLAQVSGNIHLDLKQRYLLDVYYAEHQGLGLDLRILLRTVGVVVFGEQRYVGRSLVDHGAGAVTSDKTI